MLLLDLFKMDGDDSEAADHIRGLMLDLWDDLSQDERDLSQNLSAALNSTINKKPDPHILVRQLLDEVPDDTVVVGGEAPITVAMMKIHADQGSLLAQTFFSDLLRIARDLLIMKVNKEG